MSSPTPTRFENVTAGQWDALAGRRIFFGHQSVGRNVLAGVEAVMSAHPEVRLRLVETATLEGRDAPGLYHANIGRNGDPGSKVDAFERVTVAGRPDVSMVKLCYVDVKAGTDADALFATYRDRIEGLRERAPGVVVAHLTMPLTTIEPGGWKLWLKRLRDGSTRRDLNLIRNRYNGLLRQEYVGRDPVFDIAEIESTRPDGGRSAFVVRGRTIQALYEGFTDDGGHLNELGRHRVAKSFLAFLASLSTPASAEA